MIPASVMVSDIDYMRGDVPRSQLGLSWRSWKRPQIGRILTHYGVAHNPRASKIDLLRDLNELVKSRSLTRNDRINILAGRADAQAVNRGTTFFTPEGSVATVLQINPIEAEQTTVDNTSVDCVVCFETLNRGTVPSRRITNSCDHAPNVCLACVATSITTQLESKVWNHIDCPSCAHRLRYEDIQAFGTPTAYKRYFPYTVRLFYAVAEVL